MASRYFMEYNNAIKNSNPSTDNYEHKPLAMTKVSMDGGEYESVDPSMSEKYVAIVPIKESIVKYMDWWSYGTEFYTKVIRELADDDSVVAIILDIDSGGGSGDAVENPSSAIQYARTKKKVYTFAGNGNMCSAAYWIGSNADKIFCEFPTDYVGSIGTYIQLLDWEKAISSLYQSKFEMVYAPDSDEKNLGYRAWVNGNDKPLIENDLVPFNDRFIQVIKTNRPNISADALHGATYFPDEAMKLGLIDGIASLKDVIDLAFSEATTTQSNSPSMFGKKNYVKDLISAKADERTTEMFQGANDEIKDSGLQIVDTTQVISVAEHTRLMDELKQTNTADSAALVTASATLTAAANALGLVQGENGQLTNSEGEVTTIADAIAVVTTQRDEYGQKAGVITAVKTEGQEHSSEESATGMESFYASVNERINSI